MPSSSSTTTSLPPHAQAHYLPPTVPPSFLRQVIVTALLKRGFEGAESGALVEIERLLERHIDNILEDAKDYAHLSNRREANAFDLLRSQEDSGWGSRRLRKESKKRRRDTGPQVEFVPSPREPGERGIETLSSFIASELSGSGLGLGAQIRGGGEEEEDRKPDLSRSRSLVGSGSPAPAPVPGRAPAKQAGPKLDYAFEGAPSLPEGWTYKSTPLNEQEKLKTDNTQHVKVTSALLDFIKLTATERGDIPPELGVVDYRRVQHDKSGSVDVGEAVGGKRRKWGVKGKGVTSD